MTVVFSMLADRVNREVKDRRFRDYRCLFSPWSEIRRLALALACLEQES